MSDLNFQVAPMANVERVAQVEQEHGLLKQQYLQQAAVAEAEKQRSQVQKTQADESAHKVRDDRPDGRQNSPEQEFSRRDGQPGEQSEPESEQPFGKEWVGVILNVKA